MSNRPAIEHIGIFGATMTGKSTLQRKMSRQSDRDILIYDPTGVQTDWRDGWRPGNGNSIARFLSSDTGMKTKIFDNPEQFYLAAKNSRDTDLFIDESDTVFSHETKYRHALMTKGRHNGLRLFIATQRPRMIAPSVRQQCSVLYIFRLAHDDMQQVVKDAGFNVGDIPCALPRKQGECITVDTYEGELHSGFANCANIRGL